MQVQHDAAHGFGLPEFADQSQLPLHEGFQRFSVILVDCALHARGKVALNVGFQSVDRLIQTFLLQHACGLTGKFRAIQIGIRTEPASARQELP